MEIFTSSQNNTYYYSKAGVYIEKKSTEIADSISKKIENAVSCTERQNV